MNARWLTDLDQFNEWMNEEDYELTQAEIEVLVLYTVTWYSLIIELFSLNSDISIFIRVVV